MSRVYVHDFDVWFCGCFGLWFLVPFSYFCTCLLVCCLGVLWCFFCVGLDCWWGFGFDLSGVSDVWLFCLVAGLVGELSLVWSSCYGLRCTLDGFFLLCSAGAPSSVCDHVP